MFNTITPLQKITDSLFDKHGVEVYVKRIDLIHPKVSGNKWFKLKYNLAEAKKQKKKTLLTFGGAYSNHIVAVAAAGKEFGFNTIGVIRGEEERGLNERLQYAVSCGMHIYPITREEYRQKNNEVFVEKLRDKFGCFYLLPEGGSNELAVKGCAEITDGIDILFDFICCSCGTGATLAGIVRSLKSNQKAIGFSSLNAAGYLENEIQKYIPLSNDIWNINDDYHFGGYAKKNEDLINFILDFENKHGIAIDKVYTGKMMYGIYDLIQKRYFKKGSTIIALHTGGLFSS